MSLRPSSACSRLAASVLAAGPRSAPLSTSSPPPRTWPSLDARGGRRQGQGRRARPRLPGPALRRGQAQLHPQAQRKARPADRRRPRAGDRLAAAAHHSRAATRRSSPAPTATSTPRSPRSILEIPTGQITRAMGDVHPAGNPHYWLDPGNGRRIAQAIQAKLARMSPADAAYFAAALRGLRPAPGRGREALGRGMMAPYKGLKVVTYHRSWPNFCERFGLDVIGYVEPKPGIPPSPEPHDRPDPGDEARRASSCCWSSPTSTSRRRTRSAARPARKVLVMPPSVGGEKEITDYIKLFDYDVNLLVAAIRETERASDGPRRSSSSWPRPSRPA